MDSRYQTLAEIITKQVVSIQPGEKVLIEITNTEDQLAAALIREIYKAGGKPFYVQQRDCLKKSWLAGADEEILSLQAKWDRQRMEEMDVYIGLRLNENPYDLSGIPVEKEQIFRQCYEVPVHFETRLPKTRWLAMRVPNAAMALEASMGTAEFEDFYFRACSIDYREFARRMEPLAKRMEDADLIRIKGADVDLTFHKKGIPVCVCHGTRNLPAGEVFSAPIRDSVEGYIRYNVPSIFDHSKYEGIRLEFHKGRIMDVSCSSGDLCRLRSVFELDEGAGYIGEFAMGTNPFIDRVIGDILFDEKSAGSFHFTPGRSYDACGNENVSSVHWDLIYHMQPEYGGGEIWFDHDLIQRDGLYIPEDLQLLNPEKLKNAIGKQ